jgi:gamma-D-glutamyl-L-lysine dipeptidyl-peptidase
MIQRLQICTNHLEKKLMNNVINLLSVVPMRREAAHRSELVSQLLFGEYAEILEEEDDFVRVKSLYDDYEGWVQANQLTTVDEVLATESYVGDWCKEVLVGDKRVRASLGSPVYTSEDISVNIAGRKIEYLQMNAASSWNSAGKKFSKENLQLVYEKFLNTPYLWGGKSVFGVDCSGFAQQVYKMFGVKLLRDAYLQAEQGMSVMSIEETRLGDLAFFHNEKGRVTHVGIMLENNQIVHASGRVRIDTIDKDGILNTDTGKRTHQLHSTRRIF